MSEPVNAAMKWLRSACRCVADQYDEFGTIYDEALDDLYNAEAAFWKAIEPPPDPEEESKADRAMKDAFEAGRDYEAERQWRDREA